MLIHNISSTFTWQDINISTYSFMTNMSICVNLETGLIVFVDDRDIIIFVHRRVFLKKKKNWIYTYGTAQKSKT